MTPNVVKWWWLLKVKGLLGRLWCVGNINNNSNANGNNNLDNNNGRLVGIARPLSRYFIIMSCNQMFKEIYSYENLRLAFNKARKRKTQKPYVIEFEKDLKNNILELKNELIFHCYKPRPLTTFILRDPKTRKINKSDFRDRIVHHALCNILEPIFDKTFIYDSYANRIGKGTLNAIKRFDYFKRKVSKNNTKRYFVFKADIKHYFDNVNHNILLKIIENKIKDEKIIWLIKIILSNHSNKKGMPLGNLTSQFFANIYLNELDQFIKHKLRCKYYIRYVDDFVLLHSSKENLKKYKLKIDKFLQEKLKLTLHPEKSKIILFEKGIGFLGLRIFTYHKLLKKKNIIQFEKNFQMLCDKFDASKVSYDKIYNFLEGWFTYSKNANTYKFRKIISQKIATKFNNEFSTKEINRLLKLT